MVMEADKWLPQNGKSGRGRDQDYKAQEETCKGDGYVIILNVVMISQECKHQIVYFKHVQLTVCQLCLNKAVKKKKRTQTYVDLLLGSILRFHIVFRLWGWSF